MLAQTLMNLSQLVAATPDVRWMGHDYVLSLIAATFPAWALFTLLRGWCGQRVAATTATFSR